MHIFTHWGPIPRRQRHILATGRVHRHEKRAHWKETRDRDAHLKRDSLTAKGVWACREKGGLQGEKLGTGRSLIKRILLLIKKKSVNQQKSVCFACVDS